MDGVWTVLLLFAALLRGEGRRNERGRRERGDGEEGKGGKRMEMIHLKTIIFTAHKY